jgi:hypothetical protein
VRRWNRPPCGARPGTKFGPAAGPFSAMFGDAATEIAMTFGPGRDVAPAPAESAATAALGGQLGEVFCGVAAKTFSAPRLGSATRPPRPTQPPSAVSGRLRPSRRCPRASESALPEAGGEGAGGEGGTGGEGRTREVGFRSRTTRLQQA